MRKRHLVVGGAVAAAVFAMYGTSYGAKTSKIPQNQIAVKDPIQSPQSAYSLGLIAAGAPEASATWIGPPLDPSANPPTDPREGFYNVGSNWVGGSFPNGATDVATWNNNGDLFGYRSHLTGDVTLAGVTFNVGAGVDLVSGVAAGTRTVTTGTGGLQINANVLTFQRSLGQNRFITVGDVMDFAVAGAGALVKNGPGDIWIARDSNQAGGTTVNGGRLIVFSGAPSPNRPAADYGGLGNTGNNVFGASNAPLTINDGGGIYIRQDAATGSSFIMTRPVVINGNVDIDFDGEGSPEFTGGISGTGNLRMGDGGDSIFSAATSYTGETIIDNYDFHTLRFDGANVNSSAVRNFGRYDLINGLSFGDVNRHGDSAPIYNYGTEIVMGGGSAFDATEDVGNLVLRTGQSVLSIRNPGFQLTTFSADALVRENRSTIFLRGQNIGDSTAGFARSRILLTSAPTLVNGIVPWVSGISANDPLVEDETGIGRQLPVTYDVDGLRPLRASEMTASVGAGGHVLLPAGANAGNGVVNSLSLAQGANVSGSIQVNSGYVGDQGPGSTISANLAFGGSEAVFHTVEAGAFSNSTLAASAVAQSGLTVSGVISGTNGLTKSGKGDLILSGANTFSGPVNIDNGRVVISADVLPSTNGPLGNSTSPIMINASVNGGAFEWQGDESSLVNGGGGVVTIGRNIVVGGQNQAITGATIGNINDAGTLRITGNVDLGSTTSQDVSGNNVHLTAAFGTVIIDGVVSGPGRLETNANTTLRLNGANTHSGGTELGVGNWTAAVGGVINRVQVGNNSAFGTGPVNVTFISQLEPVGGAKTIANDFLLMGGIQIVGTDQFTFTGTWDLNVNQSRQAFNIGSTTIVNFNGSLVDGGIFKLGIGTIGNGTFGAGTMNLNAANQFNSVVQVGNGGSATAAITPGGVLVARHPQALGSSGQGGNFTRVLDGSSLFLDAANGNINMPDEEIVANGSGHQGLGAIRNVSGNNIVGNLDLLGFLSAGVTTPANMEVNVVAGSSLTAGTVFDLSGTVGTAVPPDPALRGPGSGTLTKSGGGDMTIARVFNTETASAGVPPITGGATNAAKTLNTKKAIGGFVINGGTLRISTGAGNNQTDKISVVKAVTIASAQEVSAGRLDLTNNSMVIDYTGANPRAGYEALIAEGRTPAGNWSGNGITSSAAAAGPSGRFALGIADPSDTSFTTSFLGVPIDADSVLIRYTLSGDLNIDGAVDFNDFGLFGPGFNGPARWATGDFTYDGVKDLSDFALLAANFNQVLPRGVGASAVPEPASLGLIGLAVAGLAARRRRH